ncbi:MAG: CoA transferase [Chloroflexi bacterium]|nr:CoA transferase [Chloroflexota bacterium]
MPDARELPLSGVRILSQAIVWAGPFGSMILADLGADIIEIESIQHLNPTRANMRHYPDAMLQGPTGAALYNRDASDGFWNRGATFNFAKRGHRSVTLDLMRDEGRELFFGLVREADVFIENNAADVVGDLGIDWPTLHAVNPLLIMVRFPGFGLDGPYAHFKGYGATMEAVVGHTMLRGYRDSDPSLTPPIYHGDPNAGAHVAFSVQAALIARERTGEGQLIEISQAEAVLHHTSYALLDYVMNGRVQEHWGNRHPAIAPYGLFPTRGEARFVALAVDSDAAFAALCGELGCPELASDARFADAVSRYREQDALEPLLAALTRERDERELMERLQAAGVMAAMVAHQDEMTDDPHLRAREFFVTLEHPEVPVRPYPGPMARFRELPLVPVRGPAPLLGQHTREVLGGILGLDDTRLDQLSEAQITGDAYLESAR